MEHVIDDVRPGSVAARHGIRAGDLLISLNGEEIIDDIDYQVLSTRARVDVRFRHEGEEKLVQLLKAKGTPLGLTINSISLKPRVCRNKCVFCFIDQMPKGMRETLYVKDDDWRMSLMMGNYITLTNVNDEEFARMIRRKPSPLFISVHTTDPELRKRMLKNPLADRIMERLRKLKEIGIHFHVQIVLCPGWNDGDALERTLNDLSDLMPSAVSAALVPVGLTKYRDGLEKLRPYTKEEARAIIAQAERWQEKLLEEHGTRFVFPSDEMYCIAGLPYPEDDCYEGYPQIENGVGLLRQFENALKDAAEMNTEEAVPRKVLIGCGTSIAPVMERWVRDYGPKGAEIRVKPVLNRFFGETVTVTGLLTGQDLKEQLQDEEADEILICQDTLRDEKDKFLDDMTLEELNAALGGRLTIVPNRGQALFRAMLGKE